MPFALVRIDDRLIHGQVVLGWARVLKPDRIVVANDRVVANGWEQRLFAASVPPHLKTAFLTVEDAARKSGPGAFEDESVILLFESISDLYRASAAGARFDDINVGGLHYREGTREVLPFVYLSLDDRRQIRELIAKGMRFVARDIPGNPAVDLDALVTRDGPSPSGGI